jgi:hypothetical protein
MKLINSDTGEMLTETAGISTTDTPTLGLRYLELKEARSVLYKALNAIEDTIMQRMEEGGTTAILEGGVEISIKEGTPKYRVDDLLSLSEELPEVYEEIVVAVPATVKVDGRKIRSWRAKSERVDAVASAAQEASKLTLEIKQKAKA